MADKTVSYEFKGQFQNLTAGLAAAGQQVKALGTELGGLDAKGAKSRQALSDLAGTAGKFGLAAAAGLGLAVKEAAGFESAMARIQVLAGVSAGEIDGLSQDIRNLGKEYGVSATEAADAFFFLVSGLGDTAVATEALDAALKGAAVGLGTVEDLSQAITSAVAGYGAEVISAAEVTDILGAAAQKAVLAPDELAKGLTRVIPAAAQMGVSLEDLSATMALISPAFDSAAEAGTGIQAVFTALNRAAPEAQKELAKVGLTFEDLRQTAGTEGLSGALLQLGEAFDGNVEGLTRTLGSTEAARVAMALTGRTAEDVASSMDAVANATGFVDEAFDVVSDTAGFKTKQALAEMKDALIGIGDVALPMASAVVEAVGSIVGAFNDLPGPMKSVTTGLLAITAVVGASAWFGAAVITRIAATNGALAALGVTARITAVGLARLTAAGAVLFAFGKIALDVAKSNNEAEESFRGVQDAVDSMDIVGAKTQLSEAAAALKEFREQADLDFSISNPLDDGDSVTESFVAWKNAIEGALGDSDVEELEARGATAQRAFDGLAGSAIGLADALGVTLGPLDGSTESVAEMQAVLTQAQPWMEQLRITQGDLALAFLVSTGEATSFQQILATGKPTFDEYMGQIEGAAGAEGVLAAETEKVTEAAARATAKTQAQADALAAVREAAQGTAASFMDFAGSTDAATESLGGWLRSLEEQADALANFTQNTIAAGENGVKQGLIDQLRELGPEGAKQMKWLANATEQEVARANKAFGNFTKGTRNLSDAITGVPQLNIRVQDAEGRARIKEVQRLLDKFGMTKAEAKAFLRDAATDKISAVQRLVDQYGITKAEAQALLRDLASAGIEKVRRNLRDLDGDTATTYVRNITENVVQNRVSGTKYDFSADGSTVPRDGGPYRDYKPYLLAGGEEVISNRNGQADRHRPLLKAINAGRLAEGGTAGSPGFSALSFGLGAFNANPLAGLSALLNGLHDLSEKEVEERQKDLDRIRRLSDKSLEQKEKQLAKEVEADKARLRAMKEMQAAFSDQVASLNKTSAFAPTDKVKLNNAAGSVVDLPSGMDLADELAFLQSQGATGYTSISTPAAANLSSDVDRIKESLRLYKQLRARGFDGPAFRELVGNADVETLAAYAALPAAELAQIEGLYAQRDRLAQQAGQFVGQAEFGKNVDRLAAASQESLAEFKAFRQDARETNRRLDRIEKRLDKAPKDTGEAVGKEINQAVTSGRRGNG